MSATDSTASLLRGLLALRHFQVSELSAYAGVDQGATLSFLADRSGWMEASPPQPLTDLWRVRREAVTAIQMAIPPASTGDELEDLVTSSTSVGPVSTTAVMERAPAVGSVDTGEGADYALALRLVADAETSAISAAPRALEGDDARESGTPIDRVASPRGLSAASIYLGRCESTYWSQQLWRRRQQDAELAGLRALRQRLDTLRGVEASSEKSVSSDLQECMQDWSRPLTPILLDQKTRTPAVLETLSDGDVSHWVTSDLGLSTPWYQAASRAAALRRAFPQRWQSIRAGVIQNCLEVLRLSSCVPALASISAIATSMEADELAMPLLGALLLATPSNGSPASGPVLASHERRIAYMALCRLAQAPTMKSRVHSHAAFACELLLSRGAGDGDYELLAPGAILGDMALGLPWLSRAANPPETMSPLFYRNVAKAIFLTARDSTLRTALSAVLTTPNGLILVNNLQSSGGARFLDGPETHLLIPSDRITDSMKESLKSDDLSLDILNLPLDVPEDSEAAVHMSVTLSMEINLAAKGAAPPTGWFSRGLSSGIAPSGLRDPAHG